MIDLEHANPQLVIRQCLERYGWEATPVGGLCFEFTKFFGRDRAVVSVQFEPDGEIRAANAHDGFSPPENKLLWVLAKLMRTSWKT